MWLFSSNKPSSFTTPVSEVVVGVRQSKLTHCRSAGTVYRWITAQPTHTYTGTHWQLSAWTIPHSNNSVFPTEPAVRKNMGKSESQMDIMEKSTKPGKRRWTVGEISLSVLLLMVSCALAGIVVLYMSAMKGKGETGCGKMLWLPAVMTSVSLTAHTLTEADPGQRLRQCLSSSDAHLPAIYLFSNKDCYISQN